jgi:archaellum component FlaC
MKQETYERIFSAVSDAEQTVKDLAFRLSDLSQDLTMLREELEQLVDEDRYHRG